VSGQLHTLAALLLGKETSQHPLDGRLAGLRSWSGRRSEENVPSPPLPGIEVFSFTAYKVHGNAVSVGITN